MFSNAAPLTRRRVGADDASTQRFLQRAGRQHNSAANSLKSLGRRATHSNRSVFSNNGCPRRGLIVALSHVCAGVWCVARRSLMAQQKRDVHPHFVLPKRGVGVSGGHRPMPRTSIRLEQELLRFR